MVAIVGAVAYFVAIHRAIDARMLTLRLLERVRDVPREAWDAIAHKCESPFIEWTWLDALEETGCVGSERGWLPRHFALFRGSELVAMAPAYVKGNSEGEFVFDWSWADVARKVGVEYYPKLVFAVPFTPATGDRVLLAPGEDRREVVRIFADAARDVCARGGLSSAHVLFPREPEAQAWEEAGLLPREGVQFHWVNEGYHSLDEFFSRFPSKKRHHMKREMNEPAKHGISIETIPPSAIDARVVDAMYAFYETTIDKYGHWGRLYLSKPFFELIAERFADRLAWVIAKKDGEPVAGTFNAIKDDRFYARDGGALPGAPEVPFLHFAVSYYHCMRECIARGVRVFEAGAGGEHKKARGFLPTLTHSAHWVVDARLRGILAPHLARERDAVRAYVTEERAQSGLKPLAPSGPMTER